jgi:hypothetical protein
VTDERDLALCRERLRLAQYAAGVHHQAFVAGSARADLNTDGVLDVSDLTEFAASFAQHAGAQ